MDAVTFAKYGITFEVGKEYENGLGTYKVLEIYGIGDTSLRIQYVSVKNAVVQVGQISVYNAEGQAQSMFKIKKEMQAPSMKRIKKRLDKYNVPVTKKWAFTLGHLARHGYINIQVGPQSIVTFPDDFRLVTGMERYDFMFKGYLEDEALNKYSYSMNIYIPWPDDSILKLLDIPKKVTRKDNTLFIYSNDFVWRLLSAGFLPGRNNENYTRICLKIPNEDQRLDFHNGWYA